MSHYLKLESLPGGLVLLTFDSPGQKVNTFSSAMIEECSQCLAELAQRSKLRGLIVTSGKSGQFIAGADLNELAAAHVEKDGSIEVISNGRRLINDFSQLPFPTVALINGPCIGGGTELALALDYRLAAAGPRTKIGLPEVKLGLIPGWGGTQRLPRLVGVDVAIEMITNGEPVDANRAVEIGLVQNSFPVEQLVAQGSLLIEESHRTGEWHTRRHQMAQPLRLNQDELQIAMTDAEHKIENTTRGQYPAQLVALRAIHEGVIQPLEVGLAIEQAAFSKVFGTPTATNLLAQFLNRPRLARETGVDDSQAGQENR